MLTKREQVIVDANMLLAGPFASIEFIPTKELIRELRNLGNPLYRPLSDQSMATLISDSFPMNTVQHVKDGKRVRGYYKQDIRQLDLRNPGKPECCRHGSPAYKYRHQMVTYFRGKAAQHICAHCGESRADDWATLEGSCPGHDPRDGYLPLCTKCHRAYDKPPAVIEKDAETA